MRPILLALVLITLAIPAFASDGVLEINQTCAVQTGCIDNSGGIGDTAGFPVTIEIPGSYILTSNLVVSDPDTDGLFIAAAPVTIDLNGFEIQGPVNCIGLGSTLTCDAGTGRGIRSSFVRSTVVNGSVIKFGSDGIQLGGRSRIERVVVERNGGNGIDVGSDSIVIDSRAYRNGGAGIAASDSSTIRNSTSASNRLVGILADSATAVLGSTARDNGTNGIQLGIGSTISGSTAYNNGAAGISATTGSTISGNTAYANTGNGISTASGSVISDNASYENTLDGISADFGCTIRGNSVRMNDGWGLDIASPLSAYRENTISTFGTTLGTVDGGTDAGGNVCNGSLTCP